MSDDPRDEIIKQFHKPCRCDHSFYEACCGNDYATQRALAGEIIRLRRILAALRESSEAVKNAAFETWAMAGTDPFGTGMFRAAVAAAEREVNDGQP